MKITIYTGGERNSLFHMLMNDAGKMDDVVLDGTIANIPSNLKVLYKLHHSKTLNKYFPLPLRGLWNKYTPLYRAEKSLKESQCLVFNNVSIEYVEPQTLNKLKRKFNVKLVLYLLDTFSSPYSREARRVMKAVKFDKIYTFHKADAEKYGLTFFDCYYSVPESAIKEMTNINVNNGSVLNSCSDIKALFWGTDGGRRPLVEQIYDKLTSNGLKMECGICFTDENLPAKEGIVYNKPLEYSELVQKVTSTDCIVDVVCGYSGGLSIRCYEAVIYGKKLISNNPLVKTMRFYNPKLMQVIEKADDIDISLLKNEINSESTAFNPYGYKGEYSSKHFIEMIKADLS